MPEIPRKSAKLFASGLTPAGNVGVYGSLAAGAPSYSADPDAIQALAAWASGFNGALIGNRSPAVQDMNGMMLVAFQQIAYLLQSGIAQWDTGTTYFTNNFVRVGVVLFVSMTDDNTGNNPVTDTNNWQPYLNLVTGPTVAAASVIFDGINSTGGDARIISSFNVDTVTRNAAGSYTVNFLNPLPSNNYTLLGSCGSEDTGAYGAGDDGYVCGNVTGQGNAIRNVNSCRLFTVKAGALVQPGCVSANFFALP